MTDVLLAERPSQVRAAATDIEPSPRRRRGRWALPVLSLALFAGALAFLLFDAAQANDRYDHARHVLARTRASTGIVSRDLTTARRDLHLVTEQAQSDSTALVQDTSQLEGARSALSAAQAHVFEQVSLLNALHSCLGGVEQALNALAVGYQLKAAAALMWVATPCSTAVAAGG